MGASSRRHTRKPDMQFQTRTGGRSNTRRDAIAKIPNVDRGRRPNAGTSATSKNQQLRASKSAISSGDRRDRSARAAHATRQAKRSSTQAPAQFEVHNGSAKAGMSFFRSYKMIVLCVVVFILLAVGLMIYPAARSYYVSLRTYDKAVAELDALENRNVEIQDSVDTLNTDIGVENYVREHYGWIKSDESAVVVTGISEEDSMSLPISINSSDVHVEDTAVEDILDFVFMVNDD